ncbi:NUDIX hydrolase [Terrisporobacter petrolearius]|uniref:NUDIX hydrolase n=1 Tax=Terrisporobacter petrolearius TaxID=1460447 RepID=UPI001D162191|nr:NUDIX hydrolase [Terrisporobacter petrolearius]MCC3865314.1 NUDIX hydrolase [Terrisporobacter petrolearius]
MITKETTVSSDLIYTGKTIKLRVDTVEVPNKGYQKREIIEHKGAVAIVAMTDDNKIVLVKQYRKAVEKELYELPAGKIEIGEDPLDCAIRELKEETGYSVDSLKLIHKYYATPGFSNQLVFIYLAKNLIPGESHLEEDEFLEVHELDKEEVYNMVISNEICDSKTVIGILLTKELI